MFLLKFGHENKQYFLHNGTQFMGGENESQARQTAIENTAKAISVGMFDITEVKTPEELSKLIGGVPYKITDFHGGLGISFMGVEVMSGI
jgi:hypothetical protein